MDAGGAGRTEMARNRQKLIEANAIKIRPRAWTLESDRRAR